MKICIYGASSNQIPSVYLDSVTALGTALAHKGHSLVFGGGASGVMGASARGFSAGGGVILGIAPRFFDADGVLYDKCTEFIYTDTMRERKQLLEDKSDAFIVAPGGVGTFDEFFEILTLKQLGRHSKPIVVFNVNGYFDLLMEFLSTSCSEKFMAPKTLELFEIINNADAVISYLETYSAAASKISETKYI